MRIAPGGVHDEASRVLTHGLGEGLGAMLNDDVAPADLAGEGGVDRGSLGVVTVRQLGDDNFGLEAGLALSLYKFILTSELLKKCTYSLALD